MKTRTRALPARRVVPHDEWLSARLDLLQKEKELTRQRAALAQARQRLPWEAVSTDYVFFGPSGRARLPDLFFGCSQLVVYHFMFGAGWEEGCPSCSLIADHLEPSVLHLRARDVSLVAVSHAPLAELEPFQRRMGWTFPWFSSAGSSFNRDYRVSFTASELARGAVEYNYVKQDFPVEEAPGLSVFARRASGKVFHTYSRYGRGLEDLIGAYTYLDFVPKGRDEDGLSRSMAWVKYHDRYRPAAGVVAR